MQASVTRGGASAAVRRHGGESAGAEECACRHRQAAARSSSSSKRKSKRTSGVYSALPFTLCAPFLRAGGWGLPTGLPIVRLCSSSWDLQ